MCYFIPRSNQQEQPQSFKIHFPLVLKRQKIDAKLKPESVTSQLQLANNSGHVCVRVCVLIKFYLVTPHTLILNNQV